MATLSGQVAIVTGASRGVPQGIALGLGEAGMTVYVTGRTYAPGDQKFSLSGTIVETANEVTAQGGKGIAIRCDHTDDEQVRAVFEQIDQEQGRLDVLVNGVWGGYEHFYDGTEFWNEKGFWTAPFSRWEKMFDAGVRAYFVSSAFAVPRMISQGKGLIVNLSSFGAVDSKAGVMYGVAKAATDRMTALMAYELKEYNIAVICLYPGLVRTESVLQAGVFDLSNSESPQFIGRVVAALAADPANMEKSGQVLVAAEAAEMYGVKDIDGKQPRSIRDQFE